jgi:filamentous hemagglutinin
VLEIGPFVGRKLTPEIMKGHQKSGRKLVGLFFNSFAVALKDALFVAIDPAIILLIALNQIAMQNVVPEFMPQGEGLPPRRLVLMISNAPLPRLGLAVDEGAHAAFQIAFFDRDDRSLWRDRGHAVLRRGAISPAGSITLQTANGNVVVAAGATVDVSGGALASINLPYLDVVDSDQGGNAGTFTVIAPNGTAQIAGNLLSGAVAGYTGGKAIFNLASGNAGALLGSIAGFTGEQSLTLATLTNNPANTVIVGNVATRDFELSIAAGNIEVSGTIDASGPSGGTIRLNAGGSLTLDGTAVLNASATSATGGNVFLGIDGESTGTLTLGNGSTINVAGAGPNGSEVWLRAPRNGNTGVAITNHGVTISGANQLIAEAVKVYDFAGGAAVDQNLTTTSQAVVDATNFMANAVTIPGFQLLPGIEFRSSGNLQLLRNSASSAPGNAFPGTSYIYNDGIDLGGLRFNGAPAVLTLRAAGNLIINGSLSDGFSAPVLSPDGMIFAVAQPVGGRSWSLNLVAGANLVGADPMGVRPSLTPGTASFDPSGSLIFNAPYLNDQNGYPLPSVVRTGTGSLALAATGNIDIQTPFGIYTAGQPSADPAYFTDPTRSFIQSLTNGKTNSYLGYDPFTRRRYDQEGYPVNLYPSYPTGGGDLTVTAHGSLIGQFIGNGPLFPQYTASQLDSFWLWTERLGGEPDLVHQFRHLLSTRRSNFSRHRRTADRCCVYRPRRLGRRQCQGQCRRRLDQR